MGTEQHIKERKEINSKGEKLAVNLEKLGTEGTKYNGLSESVIHEWYRSSQGMCFNFAVRHISGIIGLVLIFQGKVMLSTIIFAHIVADLSGFGITIGLHRLWAHRSFKAKPILKYLLAIWFSFSGQQSIWLWTAWHRAHHKFTDTDKDPHNSNRGFFYSHIGWLLTYDHKKFIEEVLPHIDMSDLEKEPYIMFHERWYPVIHVVFGFLPTFFPWYFWGEDLFVSLCVASALMSTYLAHRTFLVNSAAHLWGQKPYDTSIKPSENKFVSFVAHGEGWHNYHHTFPWDYKTSELGFYRWNFSTALIDFFAKIGWAYDLKSVSEETVRARVKRTGQPEYFKPGPWGWGDDSIPKEHMTQTEISYPAKFT